MNRYITNRSHVTFSDVGEIDAESVNKPRSRRQAALNAQLDVVDSAIHRILHGSGSQKGHTERYMRSRVVIK